LIPKTDTLDFVWRNREAPKRDNRRVAEEKVEFLRIDWSAKSIMDVYDTLKITFSEPVLDFEFDKIKIQQKVDTIWENRTFPVIPDTLNSRVFYIDRQWSYEQEYRISIDSASFFSIYGKWNDSIGTQFRFNSEKEYGSLYVTITGGDGSGFGELLDSSERVIRRSGLINDELVFEDLKPGSYFLRYIEDLNGNGKWDTGNYAEGRQPEKVYYFPGSFTIAKFGSHEQDWDIMQTPIEKQKPLEITKNKPVVKQARRTEQSDQNRQQNTGTSIPGIGGRSIPRL
jgi:nuclear transport factor 2 (NTF2) superfamily protein